MDQVEHAITFFEWLTLGAIFLGPILAVIATRIIDYYRGKRARRLELFKILMRTRTSKLNLDHVGALNLIEIEYYKERRVLDALERYFNHLNNLSTNDNNDSWLNKADHFFTKLLYEIAKSLKYEIEQLQILTGGYAPRGWSEAEHRSTEIQKAMLAVLEGESAIAVSDAKVAGSQESPFAVPPGYPPRPS